MRVYLQQVGVDAHIDALDTCAKNALALETIVHVGMEFIRPLQSQTIYSGEPSWINATLKDLIRRRERALALGNFSGFRLLRNRVNRERKACRAKYYGAKVAHLKDCKPSVWWSEAKKLSGL